MEEILDPLWLILWFAGGLVTFQITWAKKILSITSMIFTVLALLSLNQPQFILSFVGVNAVSGLFTNLVYLIGANISRFWQFGTMSRLIIVYFFALVLLSVAFA